MQYPNSSESIRDISLYYKKIDESIFKEFRFVQLMNMLLKDDLKFHYAFYTDTFLLKTNLYIPNFHTMYLSNQNHNVLISNSEDLWLLDIFKNNKYYVLEEENDTFDYHKHGVIKINHIRQILQ